MRYKVILELLNSMRGTTHHCELTVKGREKKFFEARQWVPLSCAGLGAFGWLRRPLAGLLSGGRRLNSERQVTVDFIGFSE
jgi:hypothetical protein